MMYAHNNIAEPTCDGQWWKLCPTGRWKIRSCRAVGGCWKYRHEERRRWFPCAEEGVVWTGPIPVPEDKDRPRCVCGGGFGDEHADDCAINQPAPSEDDALGRRLCKIEREEHEKDKPASHLLNWDGLSKTARAMLHRTALRFRAECVGPYEKLKEAALDAECERHHRFGPPEDEEDLPEQDQKLAKALTMVQRANEALPDQGEAAEDKEDLAYIQKMEASGTATFRPLKEVEKELEDKPRPSDEELGRFAARRIAEELLSEGGQPSARSFADVGFDIRAKLEETA